MNALDGRLRSLSLSAVNDKDWPAIHGCVAAMRDIKRNKSGECSLVAISKFLHFWNPRLFVIFDAEAMEYYAFRRPWLAHGLPSVSEMNDLCRADPSADHRIQKYLSVLRFASEFVRANPQVPIEMMATVQRETGGTPLSDVSGYEATAFEWCILGLVELPPRGVADAVSP